MQNLILVIKSVRLKQVLTVFLAGFLLIISTACSQNPLAQIDGVADVVERQLSDTYDNYDADRGYKGGMNGYDDDPRYNAETAAKAKALVDTARSRQKDSLGEYAESVVDRAGNKIEAAKQEIPSTLQANKQEAIESIENKTETLQDNLSQVPEGAKDIFEGTVDTAQDAVRDTKQATNRTAKEIKSNIKDLT